MANDSDLQNAEKRRDSQTVFNYFQGHFRDNQTALRNLQEVGNSPRFRMVSRVGAAFTNLSTEQTLISETIQGNALQSSNIIDFEIIGTTRNNSGVADNVTFKVKYGGSVLTLGPISLPTNSQKRLFQIIGSLYGNNSPSVQNFFANIRVTDAATNFGTGLVNAFAESALAVDSSVDQTFAFSVQHTTAQPAIGSTLLLYKLGAPITAA